MGFPTRGDISHQVVGYPATPNYFETLGIKIPPTFYWYDIDQNMSLFKDVFCNAYGFFIFFYQSEKLFELLLKISY